uniref:Uncharacterized protein n=1 Tax=Salmonella phage vB_Si_CECAV_FGS009 TaxID=3126494 RepID=A0AAU6PXL1_9CAUD
MRFFVINSLLIVYSVTVHQHDYHPSNYYPAIFPIHTNK